LLFVAWAGATGSALFKTLDDQGVYAVTKVITGLADRASYASFAPVEAKVTFLSYYFYQAPKTKANDFLVDALKKQGKVPDLFDPDGFVAAQMIVHAVEKADGDDASKTSRCSSRNSPAPNRNSSRRSEQTRLLRRCIRSSRSGSRQPQGQTAGPQPFHSKGV
jgi:branched-chain amino acid transport system substrate-binding protein